MHFNVFTTLNITSLQLKQTNRFTHLLLIISPGYIIN